MRLLPILCLVGSLLPLSSAQALSTVDEDTIVGGGNTTTIAAPAPVAPATPTAPAAQKAEPQRGLWKVGVTAGFSSLNWVKCNDRFSETEKYSFQPGCSFGVICRTQTHRILDFEGGIELTMLGMRRTFGGSAIETIYDTVSWDSIGSQAYQYGGNFRYAIPCVFVPIHVLLNLNYGNSWTSLFLGPSFGYALDGTFYFQDSSFSNGTSPFHYSNSWNDNAAKGLNRFLLQIQGGITQSFLLSRVPCYIYAQYSYGMLEIGKKYSFDDKAHPTEIRLGVGAFLFGR